MRTRLDPLGPLDSYLGMCPASLTCTAGMILLPMMGKAQELPRMLGDQCTHCSQPLMLSAKLSSFIHEWGIPGTFSARPGKE